MVSRNYDSEYNNVKYGMGLEDFLSYILRPILWPATYCSRKCTLGLWRLSLQPHLRAIPGIYDIYKGTFYGYNILTSGSRTNGVVFLPAQ